MRISRVRRCVAAVTTRGLPPTGLDREVIRQQTARILVAAFAGLAPAAHPLPASAGRPLQARPSNDGRTAIRAGPSSVAAVQTATGPRSLRSRRRAQRGRLPWDSGLRPNLPAGMLGTIRRNAAASLAWPQPCPNGPGASSGSGNARRLSSRIAHRRGLSLDGLREVSSGVVRLVQSVYWWRRRSQRAPRSSTFTRNDHRKAHLRA
jgi:hypothetical protein